MLRKQEYHPVFAFLLVSKLMNEYRQAYQTAPFWRERGNVRPQTLFAVGKNGTPFLSRCEALQGFTSRQACDSGRQNLLSEDFEGEAECFFIKDKDAKTGKRKACKTKLLSGEKGGPSKMVDS